MEIYERPGELYHYGRRGMKWYQNIFTKDKAKSGQNKRKSRAKQNDDLNRPKPKSYKDMSDDELRKSTDRLNLEANYLNAKSRVNPNPEQSQKRDSFAKRFVKEALGPAIISAGKTQIEKYLNTEISKLTKGKVDTNSIEYLKTQAEKSNLKKQMSVNKKMILTNEDWFAKREADIRAAKEAENRKAEAQKQVDDYNKGDRSRDTATATNYAKRGEEIVDRYTQTGSSSKLPAVRILNPSANNNSNSEKASFEITTGDGETIQFDKNGRRRKW